MVIGDNMKAYKGLIKITCGETKGCLRNLKVNVQPGCMDCPKAVTEIIDYDEKVLYEYKSPAVKTGKRKNK